MDKLTGADVWKSDASATAGYSSCMTITEGGNTIIVNGSQSGLLVVDAKNGDLIHKHEFAVRNSDLNCHPGNYVVADGCVYGKGERGLTCVDLKTGETQWQEPPGILLLDDCG